MSKEVKSKIHELIDSIEDENVLQMVMEDVAYYTSNNDIIDELSEEQLKELNEAISETDNNETTDWDDFKKEMNEWKKDSCLEAFSKEYIKSISVFNKRIFCKTAFNFPDKSKKENFDASMRHNI